MPTDDPALFPAHLRLSFGGSLGDPPVEIWSNTVNFMPDPVVALDAAIIDNLLDAVLTPVSDWFSSVGAAISTAATLDYVKLNWIASTGRQRDPLTNAHYFAPPIQGSNAGQVPPWEVTYALTERTALPRGRSHAGRIYPPVPVTEVDGLGPYITEASALAMATAFATCLSDCTTAMTATGLLPAATTVKPAVVAAGYASKSTSGIFQYITGIEVDRVPDMQHRRTNRVVRAIVPAVPLTV